MPSGTPAGHTDFIRPFREETEGEYATVTTYEAHQNKDEYGDVVKRYAEEIELAHPVASITELRRTTHIQAQFHEENATTWADEEFPNDGGVLYDLAILSVLDCALDEEGLAVDDFDVPERRVKAIGLYHARHAKNLETFYEHLTDTTPVLEQLGYRDGFVSKETFRRAAHERLPAELADRDGEEAFAAVIERAVYAVYRNGIVPPERVRTEYAFDELAPPLSPSAVSRPAEQEALGNWIRLLADKTLAPLTFGRSDPELSLLQFFGSLAASAKSGAGLQDVPNELDYAYPRRNIPDGSGFSRYVRRFARDREALGRTGTREPSIVTQFDRAHRATLELANRRGFFDEPRSVAVDLFRVEWMGADNDVTINRPAQSKHDPRSQWTYAVPAIVNTEGRFTLGVRWLPTKDQYPTKLRELSQAMPEFTSVETVYADSESVSGALLETLQSLVGDDCVVKAPDHDIIKNLKRLTPTNKAGYVSSVAWNTPRKPNVVTYPVPGENVTSIDDIVEFDERTLRAIDSTQLADAFSTEQPTLSEFTDLGLGSTDSDQSLQSQLPVCESEPGVGDVSTHNAYLTFRSLPDLSPAGSHYRYYNRWAIEESINQISNDFMPHIASGDERLRLYGVNTAVLIQNWHTLINRAPSPKRKLPLDVTHNQLLAAIIHAAFGE